MRTTAFEEYPHETTLRLKKEAASDLYDALKLTLDYRQGNGRFNFSHLVTCERENEMFDAWQEVEQAIVAALAKAEGRS